MYLSVFVTTTAVVTKQKLIAENSTKKLGAIIIEATMPYSLIQPEQRLEPFIERFDTKREDVPLVVGGEMATH